MTLSTKSVASLLKAVRVLQFLRREEAWAHAAIKSGLYGIGGYNGKTC